MRRLAWLLLVASVAAPAALHAQYFGGNRVQYSHFDFKILETEHFDLYYYESEHEAAVDVARMAERSYARLSKVLRHTFRERKPIILYASESDFQQTNTSPDEVSEGTGGFTDFLKHRIVIPVTGSYADVAHVLQHEMTHQFQYDIWSGGRAGAGIQTIIAVNPPLWFVEGMAEYLSIGGVDPNTAMWLRDAAAEGKVPTIHQLETDPRIFPYRFGQAILTYIGQRWGDEVLGAILNASRSGGLEAAFRRNIGLDFNQLSDQWRDAVQREYLPELNSKDRASEISAEVLTKAKSEGTLHLAPALSPDGTQVAYFSEKNFYFIDLWLANVSDGKAIRRLFKSTWSSNYETFRFINSSAAWSPDGKYLAFGGKRGATDDIIVLDVANNKEVNAIHLNLNGVTTPSWSPDGQKLVFTGYDGGMSDLFVVDRDGKNLKRLTNDKYADLNPVWSPDGQTIAFTTDRGPETDFSILKVGNYRIALYHLDSGRIDLLQGMDVGKNSDPQWSPDGHELAYVSDRTGVSNIYLYDLASSNSYQITDFFTGVQGITPLSPVLSWARQANKLAYVYYQKGDYDVYVMSDPDSRKKAPYQAPTTVAVRSATGQLRPPPVAAPTTRDTTAAAGSTALYRSATGLRPVDSLVNSSVAAETPSMKTLIDSANLALPDTNTFIERKYKPIYTPDFVSRPSIGYARSNFGQGVYGGTSVELSDMLGDHQLLFSGYVNGRIDEAQVLAAYVNLTRRVNWAAGISQDPYFFYQGDAIQEGTPSAVEDTYIEEVRRIVLRSAFITGGYPLSRFQRFEGSLHLTNVEDAILDYNEPFDPVTGELTEEPSTTKTVLESKIFAQPSLAWVYDNSIDGYTGPALGRRSRFEIAPAIGGWNYNQITADYRRYDHLVGPFTLATRVMYFGRTGPQATEFSTFLGYPDFIRGYTEGSFLRNECANPATVADSTSQTGCAALDQMVGTSIGVANGEIRFPLLEPGKGFVPSLFPPIEGAFFYDAGIAWNPGNTLAWSRPAGASPSSVRVPLRSVGVSLKINLLGYMVLRFDYAKPLQRPGTGPYWTISFGPSY
ncbi:MAG TPA: DPP IV N-terminal domain-containing protein [Gemmatimonadales bacterium]|nr:DPP IV N-terminal domain-containing protein [Gemmatimonadales bacterium]